MCGEFREPPRTIGGECDPATGIVDWDSMHFPESDAIAARVPELGSKRERKRMERRVASETRALLCIIRAALPANRSGARQCLG